MISKQKQHLALIYDILNLKTNSTKFIRYKKAQIIYFNKIVHKIIPVLWTTAL
jgi:hypothetical protein